MHDVASAINRTIPITQFNRGAAGKIFEDVKRTGAKVVMKNNVAECVLISPKDYTDLIDELNDAYLLALANERLANFDISQGITEEEFDRKFGFTPEILASVDEVEFE